MFERVRGLLPTGDFRWHDYGCAEGDGLAYVQARLPEAHCKGFDLSVAAVTNALARWHGVEFEVGDVTEPSDRAEVISTLHTLEHVAAPVATLRRLREHANLVIAVTPPVTEVEHGGHTGMKSDDYCRLVQETFDVRLHDVYRTERPYLWRRGVMEEGDILFVV